MGRFRYCLRIDFPMWSLCSLGLPLGYATEYAIGALSMPLGHWVCHWGTAYAIGAADRQQHTLWASLARSGRSCRAPGVLWSSLALSGEFRALIVLLGCSLRGPWGLLGWPCASPPCPGAQWHTQAPSGILQCSSGKPSGNPSGKLTKYAFSTCPACVKVINNII